MPFFLHHFPESEHEFLCLLNEMPEDFITRKKFVEGVQKCKVCRISLAVALIQTKSQTYQLMIKMHHSDVWRRWACSCDVLAGRSIASCDSNKNKQIGEKHPHSYRSPHNSNKHTFFSELSDSSNKYDNLIVMGDLNIARYSTLLDNPKDHYTTTTYQIFVILFHWII